MSTLRRTLEHESNAKDIITEMDNSTGWNAMFLATVSNQPEILKYLLEFGIDIETLGPKNFSVLPLACRIGHLSIITILLQYGADPYANTFFGGTTLHTIARFATVEIGQMVFGTSHRPISVVNWKDDHGLTPLHYAVFAGKKDMCGWLISRGADIRVTEANQATPFITACRYGDTSIMELFVSLGDCVHSFYDSVEEVQHLLHQDRQKIITMMEDTDDEGMSAFHHAVSENNQKAVETLLHWGSQVNSTTNDGSTPLHICATNGHTDLVPILVHGGAKLDTYDSQGNTPLHKAAEFRQIDTLISLINQGANINQPNTMGCTPLYIACVKGFTDVVERLLTFKADYTLTDFLAKSCLYVAVEGRHWEVTDLMLKTGDSSFVTLKDLVASTALHVAARLKDIRFARALLQYKELANIPDLMGKLPLHHAARSSTSAMVEMLAKVTKDIDAETIDSRTPLLIACQAGNIKCALTLIKMGADINDRDVDYHNTLMVAASSGSTSLVVELIKHGAKVNSVDKEKNTSLHLACSLGHLSTVKALLENGASVTNRNSKQETPLLLAVNMAQEEVAVFLLKHESWEQSMSAIEYNGSYCLDAMVTQTPQAVKVLLDNCWGTYHGPYDSKYRIEIGFKYLDTKPDAKNFRKHVYKSFKSMIENNREDLLSHPVCQSFLAFKWNSYGRFSLLYNIVVQSLFFAFAAFYTIYLPKLDTTTDADGCNITPPDYRNVSVTNDTRNETASSSRTEHKSLAVTLSVFGIVVSSILICAKEVRFLCSSGVHYAMSKQFVITLLSVCFTLSSFFPIGFYPCASNWRLLYIGLLFHSYSSSIVFMRIDYIGLYFSMFYEVLQTIVKMSMVLAFFIAMFSVPMRILLRHQDGFKEDDPFPLTVLAMTVGELNFRDNFIKGDNSPFTVDLYIFFVGFVAVMNITFMNMMIGAAVGDINNVEKRAYLTRLKNQVSFLEEVESAIIPSVRWRFYVEKYVNYPNDKSSKWWKMMKGFIAYDAMMFITRDSEKTECEKLQEVIMQQNERNEELKEMISCIHADIKRVMKQGLVPCQPLDSEDDDLDSADGIN